MFPTNTEKSTSLFKMTMSFEDESEEESQAMRFTATRIKLKNNNLRLNITHMILNAQSFLFIHPKLPDCCAMSRKLASKGLSLNSALTLFSLFLSVTLHSCSWITAAVGLTNRSEGKTNFLHQKLKSNL